MSKRLLVPLKSRKLDGRGKHPNSLAALKPTQFKPGQNGNPHPGYSLTSALRDSLGKPLIKPDDNASAAAHIVYTTLKGAKDCIPVAFREVWDRAEGKVPEKRELTGVDGGPVLVSWVDLLREADGNTDSSPPDSSPS